MSYGGEGYSGYSRGRGREGTRPRGRGTSYQTPNHGLPQDPAIVIPGRQLHNPPNKKIETLAQKKARLELTRNLIEEENVYSKSELLEMFCYKDFEKSQELMKNFEGLDLVTSHSQNPVLLGEGKDQLTLEDLRPKKGYGGPRKRGIFY